ncbi:unnamed protein product [Thelazia callipaeda]|uniref:Uncharacterized protein n=1 Tax=Thelazia callipaeda TaxID=103827 RepID=A0A0N5DAL2_THECL|nr:unnamed protein product [Thelazia callipaeda]
MPTSIRITSRRFLHVPYNVDVKEKHLVLMQDAQGREINQTKWTRSIGERRPAHTWSSKPSSERRTIRVESKHRKEDRLVEFPQIHHRTNFGRRKTGRVDTRVETAIRIKADRPHIMIHDKKRREVTPIEVGTTSQDSRDREEKKI